MQKIIKILVFLLLPISLMGQLAPVTNQYMLNPLIINPAYAGARGALNLAAFYRKQWVGIKGAPQTMTLVADAPLSNEKIGLGIIFVNDKTGVTKENQLITNYSYKINLGEGTLSFGLGAGFMTTNTAWSELVVLDPGDEFYMIDSRVFFVPNFSFGSYYTNKNFFAGLSIPKFLNYKFNFDKNKYSLANDPGLYNYMLTAGYLVPLSSRLNMTPSTLLTYSSDSKLLFDLNATFNYDEQVWAGASYRNSRSIAVFFQVRLNPQLKAAYSYDIDLGKLGRYSNGSHEIMLRYEFRYKVDVVNPLNF